MLAIKSLIKEVFDFYVKASIHVSLAVFSLVQMTFYFCQLPFDWTVSLMAFSGTLFAYNFIKYEDFIRRNLRNLSFKIKSIVALSIVALMLGGISFLYLTTEAQVLIITLLLLAILYTIPVSKMYPNLRNLSGIKVYIVCLCWVCTTLIIPLLNANYPIDNDILLKCLQRFVLVFILIGIFEIVDLQYDEKYLKTIPQQLGVVPTKIVLSISVGVFFILEFFKIGTQAIQIWNSLVISIITLFCIWLASYKRNYYYTHFWVESIPIVWWLLVIIEH